MEDGKQPVAAIDKVFVVAADGSTTHMRVEPPVRYSDADIEHWERIAERAAAAAKDAREAWWAKEGAVLLIVENADGTAWYLRATEDGRASEWELVPRVRVAR